MPKTKISEFSATPGNNTDIDGINIAEGCAPSGINDAIRELMSQLKDFQAGTAGDSFNGPVGTTTAAAGAFTTLSASGAVTLSGGTANGVPYLNGSKVLTTGSALTFDGDTFGVSGTATLAGSFNSTSANGTAIRLQNSSANKLLIGSVKYITGGSASEYGIGASGDNPIVFATNDVERMRLTSTGLGIGTSSPGAPLEVARNQNATTGIRVTNTDSTANNSSRTSFQLADSGGVRAAFTYINAGSASGTYIGSVLGGNLNFTSGAGVANATLDSSGNLGLGVTPSAWSSSFKALNIGANGQSVSADGGQIIIGSNYVQESGGARYVVSAAAGSYAISRNSHAWYIAPSGTAGNAISFTQAMTLTAGGRLLIGKTSTAVNNTTGTEIGPGSMTLSTNTGSPSIDLRASNASVAANIGGILSFSAVYENSTSDTTNIAYIRGLRENATNNTWSSYISFETTNGTTLAERARIDSSGNLLVGVTSGTFSQIVSGNGYAFGVSNSTTNNNVLLLAGTSGSTAQNKIVFANGGSVVGTVYTTGSATSYNTSSDYRLKENIQPMTGALAKVAALKPCTYKWKADGSDGEGFIAHELAEVVPQAVTGEKDAVDAEGKPVYQGIDTSFLVATLTAALQEAHGLIKDLQSRVAALEAK